LFRECENKRISCGREAGANSDCSFWEVVVSYKNKTYVIFDADEDMWAYAFMKGWIEKEHIAFNFYDAHDLRPLTIQASQDTVFARLRERFANAKQVIIILGEKTKDLRKFVPWEIDIAKKLSLPVVVTNLNDYRKMDSTRCPQSLREYPAVHVAFRAKIIQFALDHYPDEFKSIMAEGHDGARHYRDSIYQRLGL
jgi:hypothetical protein